MVSPTYVKVPVPEFVRIRTVMFRSPRQIQRQRRHTRVQLASLPYRYRERTIRVLAPRRSEKPQLIGSYSAIRRNTLTHYSKWKSQRLLDDEYNRKRRDERKGRRRKRRHGQLSSVRRDRYGMLGEAVRRNYSAARLDEVAMVSRALGGS